MRTDADAAEERDRASEARLRDLAPRLEELERRLRSAIGRHPAVALAVAAVAGVSLGLLPRRLKLAALALGARALTPLALGKLDSVLFDDVSNDRPNRRM